MILVVTLVKSSVAAPLVGTGVGGYPVVVGSVQGRVASVQGKVHEIIVEVSSSVVMNEVVASVVLETSPESVEASVPLDVCGGGGGMFGGVGGRLGFGLLLSV